METTERPLVYDIEGLTRVREKAGARFTLEVPRLAVAAGEIMAVLGTSGCGKSTLLDMLGLILPPTQCRRFRFRASCGTVSELGPGVSGALLANLRRTELGYVLQQGALLPFLSVFENALLPQRLAGIKDRATVNHLLERLGIAGEASKLPQHLSGGQRQRAAIARALSAQPPVVLCDEPTAAVDEFTAREIFSQLREVSRSFGVTLIVVTHNRELIRGFADTYITFTVKAVAAGEVVSTCHESTDPI